jgi:hypothetical protein
MSELYDERRQEPRFPTRGTASYMFADRRYESVVLDLSLNGMKVSKPESWAHEPGGRFRVDLSIPGADAFTAEVAVVYADDSELGLEFHDMPLKDFSVLATLIEHYARTRRLNGGSVAA